MGGGNPDPGCAGREEIAALLKFSPEYTVALADEIFAYRVNAFRERFADNLRKAGLPE